MMLNISKSTDKKELKLASLLCWHIWKSRNNVVLNSSRLDPSDTIRKAQNALDELLNLAIPQRHSENRPGRQVNVDASFDGESFYAMYGVTVRNADGMLIDGCVAKYISHSPLAAKAYALRAACLFIANRGFSPVSVETDSQQLVLLLSSQASIWPWDVKPFIHDIKSFLSIYPSSVIRYIPRAANKCADWVAKNARMGDFTR
ncbi:uncharacterized protein LOC131172141 [Hevea brasiliensis]|uniref:uncharacterized protein LOC131172141 n=1 Tax=Hevea brasiliensis TaxID=3981 RepID=UPI00260103AA|nr:uncharacterized protein LOC131172141 [Hevea brasiliensis]